MIEVKTGSIHANRTIVARVETHSAVSFNDEQQLRRLLNKFFQTPRDFSCIAMEAAGTVILFRAIPNCKRSPVSEEVQELLQAMNLWEVHPHPDGSKRSHRAKTKANNRQHQSA